MRYESILVPNWIIGIGPSLADGDRWAYILFPNFRSVVHTGYSWCALRPFDMCELCGSLDRRSYSEASSFLLQRTLSARASLGVRQHRRFARRNVESCGSPTGRAALSCDRFACATRLRGIICRSQQLFDRTARDYSGAPRWQAKAVAERLDA